MIPARTHLFALLLLVACGGGSGESLPEGTAGRQPVPVGTVWKWKGVQDADPARVDHPGRYTLEFIADGRYAVRADCNSGTGNWVDEDGALALKPGALTTAACGPASLADRFLELLATADSLQVDGDEMALRAGSADRWMYFVAMAKIVPAGTTWLVRAFNNGNRAVTSVADGTELTLSFGPDGNLSGSGGCNQFRAECAVSGNTMKIGPVASTRKMCMGDGVSEQENRFLQALATVSTWEIRGERSQLRDAEGALAVDLMAAVTGTISHRAGPAVPVDATVTVQLVDVSRADAPATLIGESRFSPGEIRMPWSFEVGFDPGEIQPTHTYALRAFLGTPDELLLTTTDGVRVLTGDAPQFGIELQLHLVGE